MQQFTTWAKTSMTLYDSIPWLHALASFCQVVAEPRRGTEALVDIKVEPGKSNGRRKRKRIAPAVDDHEETTVSYSFSLSSVQSDLFFMALQTSL